jgi:hypothetical protein
MTQDILPWPHGFWQRMCPGRAPSMSKGGGCRGDGPSSMLRRLPGQWCGWQRSQDGRIQPWCGPPEHGRGAPRRWGKKPSSRRRNEIGWLELGRLLGEAARGLEARWKEDAVEVGRLDVTVGGCWVPIGCGLEDPHGHWSAMKRALVGPEGWSGLIGQPLEVLGERWRLQQAVWPTVGRTAVCCTLPIR